VPAGPEVIEMLRMETGEPPAYTQPLDSSIYAKYSHYISGRVVCLLIHILLPLHKNRFFATPSLSSNNALRCSYESPDLNFSLDSARP